MVKILRLMSTLAVEKAFKTWILPAWQKNGAKLDVEWNPTTVLMQGINAGKRADIVILIDDPIDSLASTGVVVPESVTRIATAGFGLGIRAGSTMPDISTTEKFKAVLLQAPSIVYSRAGASGIYLYGRHRRGRRGTQLRQRIVGLRRGRLHGVARRQSAGQQFVARSRRKRGLDSSGHRRFDC
jgi:hypothetical protein